jgi:hypothetical protein
VVSGRFARASVTLGALALGACSSDTGDVSWESDDSSSSYAAGSGAAGSSSTGTAGSSASAAGSSASASGNATSLSALSFDVTTASQGGKYSPKNIGAIWVQNGSGQFVKSLEVWAAVRRKDLTRYNAAIGGSSVAVDVTASATLSSHKAHHVSWNMQDKSGAKVSDGKYTLYVEVTDSDATGQYYAVDFDTSAGAQTLTPASNSYFSAMALQMQ